LKDGRYKPRPSVPTLSNAMDIGRPNNLPRILNLYGRKHSAIQDICWGASFSDVETERHMRRIYADENYVMCPHTAVGHMAMEAFAKDVGRSFIKVTVSTAHPAKFADSVERILHIDVPLPNPLRKAMKRKKIMEIAPPNLDAIRDFIEKKSI